MKKILFPMCLKPAGLPPRMWSLRFILRTSNAILLLVLSWSLAVAQDTRAVTGKVTNEAGSPLPGVTVTTTEGGSGTVTDANGVYNLQVQLQKTLVFSYVGYTTSEIPINNRSVVNVILKATVSSLDQLVVVGYGTQRKSDLTGAVASVSSDQWKGAEITTPDQILQGRVAGVKVFKSSHEPGGGISVRIRGNASLNAGGSPLYVIDGMPVNTDVDTGPGDGGTTGTAPNPLNSIDPSSIASIDILKDASAEAIYGSRAANGVVIITTKGGVVGAQHIDFKATYGIQQVSRKLDLMNAEQWATQANERAEELGLSKVYSDEQVASFGKGTDWQDEVFRNAIQQKYELAFTGGNSTVRYRIAGNYMDEEGIVRGSSFQRYGATIRVDANPNSRVSVGGSLMFTNSQNHQVRTDTKGYEGVSNITGAIIVAPPTIPARDSSGEITNMSDYPLGGALENPLTITDKYKQLGSPLRLISNAHIQFDITKDLSFMTRLGLDLYSFRYHEYFSIGSEADRGAGGVASQQSSRSIDVLTANTLTYQKNIAKDHDLKVLVGLTYEQQNNETLSAGSHGFPSDYFMYNNLGLGTNPQSPGSYASKTQLISYLARLNYSYKNTYLLTASIRSDGSSKFGANKKYGIFPSVAVAWQASNEQFIKDLGIFSQLKLRAGYGETGNESIGPYNSLSTISTSFGTRSSYIFNGSAQPIASPSRIANPDLGWEKTQGINVGLDIGLLEDRLDISANYYYKKTTDLLLNVPIPTQSGFGSVLENTGSLENKGFEFAVSSRNISGEQFKWSTDFNISFNRNKVLSLSGAPFIWGGWVGGGNVSTHDKNTVRIEPGKPIGMYYGSIYEGIWQSQEEIDHAGTMVSARPGDIRYKDVNGDGTYDANNDDVFLGDPNPDFSYGLTNNFSFGQWSLYVFIYGEYGNDVLNLTAEHYVLKGDGTSARRLKRWTPGSNNATIPGASAEDPLRVSSFMVEDGSFLRLQNITLSYDMPVQKWKQSFIRSAQIGIGVDNLAIWTKYTGYDPEVNAFGNSNLTQSMDRYAYPAAREFRVVLSLGF